MGHLLGYLNREIRKPTFSPGSLCPLLPWIPTEISAQLYKPALCTLLHVSTESHSTRTHMREDSWERTSPFPRACQGDPRQGQGDVQSPSLGWNKATNKVPPTCSPPLIFDGILPSALVNKFLGTTREWQQRWNIKWSLGCQVPRSGPYGFLSNNEPATVPSVDTPLPGDPLLGNAPTSNTWVRTKATGIVIVDSILFSFN